MKLLLTICLLLATTITVNAQDGKPTKKQTIALINRITALSIGKQYGNKEIIITENKLTDDKYSYSITLPGGIFKDTYSDISWETLDTEGISFQKNDYYPSLVQVTVDFEKEIEIEEAHTGSETKIGKRSYMWIVIPTEKFDSIKKGFLRLAEIAKALTIKAQDGKPTKEQTMEFIVSHFKGKSFGDQCIQKDSEWQFIWGRLNTDFDLVLEGNILTVKWQYIHTYKTAGYPSGDKETIINSIAKIDLSKTEAVGSFTQQNRCKNASLLILAGFKANASLKNSYRENGKVSYPEWIEIPINSYVCNGCNNELENKKIIQAFNHLRKLCGAPEPISFDGN